MSASLPIACTKPRTANGPKNIDGPSVGILTYGSLIFDPKCEIKDGRIRTIHDVMTPFHVEFVRSSNKRGGAPTLVPVMTAETCVKGKVFVIKFDEEATDVLDRREINKVCTGKRFPRHRVANEKRVIVERLTEFAGLEVVLYTQTAANIEPITAEEFAELAIKSVHKKGPPYDGINCLIDAKKHGIVTALSPGYEAAILQRLGCGTLKEALVPALDSSA
ncbi:MAG: gamma-glutamylcyclotransferase [Paracoccaceae bacterium]|nr:gamma-glutamylcyclotransferase [Paracoccaceae bacterium]